MWYVLELTAIGRNLFATGGNREAARLAGVPTQRGLWSVFVATGDRRSRGVIFSMQSSLFLDALDGGQRMALAPPGRPDDLDQVGELITSACLRVVGP